MYLKPSQELTVPSKFGDKIETMLSTMETEIQPHSSFESKYSSLETMLQIFERVMDSGNELGHILENSSCGWDDTFRQRSVFGQPQRHLVG